MLKRFFTWGYLKFVFWPNVEEKILDGEEYELEFTPDEDLLEAINEPETLH